MGDSFDLRTVAHYPTRSGAPVSLFGSQAMVDAFAKYCATVVPTKMTARQMKNKRFLYQTATTARMAAALIRHLYQGSATYLERKYAVLQVIEKEGY